MLTRNRALRFAAAILAFPAPALAQRTEENATTRAEDAFGTSVGGEQIGIYNPNYVRGFSAAEAGNIRLEDLYFDRQANFTERLIGGLKMRVGLSAQSYPFPAPTGIADYGLRKPGAKPLLSLGGRVGPFGTTAIELDAQLPVTGRLSVGAGIGVIADRTHTGGAGDYRTAALVANWQPADGVQLLPFWSRTQIDREDAAPILLTAGDYLPPQIQRVRLLGQPWAINRGRADNFGLVTALVRGDWTIKAGLFRSELDLDKSHTQLFLNVRPDGVADEVVIAEPGRKQASSSGEMRITRRFAEGPRLHSVHASLRGRRREREYGGDQAVFIGTHHIEEPVRLPEPSLTFGPRTLESVRQWTVGLAYEGRWRDVGELSLGLQKTDYRKQTSAPGSSPVISHDAPLLFNATAALHASRDLAIWRSMVGLLRVSRKARSPRVLRSTATKRPRRYAPGSSTPALAGRSRRRCGWWRGCLR